MKPAGDEGTITKSIKAIISAIKLTIKEYWPLILLILLFSSIMYSKLETNVDKRGHLGYDYNLFNGMAEKTVQYGFIKTKFGQAKDVYPDNTHANINSNKTDVAFNYYVHHPPLLTLLIALAFMMLKTWTHKAAATLVPTIFSIGSLSLVYLIGRKLWSRKVAFISTFAMGMTPIFQKYGQLVCHEPPTTFFILAIVYGYMLWVDAEKQRYLALTCAMIVAGGFTGWPAYYTVPLLAAHYLLFGRRMRIRTAITILFVGALTFSIVLTHLYILGGSSSLLELEKALKNRGNYDEKKQSFVGDNVKVLLTSTNDVKNLNTSYIFYAAGLLIASIAYKLIKKKEVIKESYIVILILVGVIHDLLWPWGVGFHDYWHYYLTPGLALAAVVGIDSALNSDREYKEFLLWLVLGAFWLLNMPNM